MSAPDDGEPDARAERQLPKKHFRALFIGTVLVILVVIFGYLLLVGTQG